MGDISVDSSNPPAGVLAPPPAGAWNLTRCEPQPDLVDYIAWTWSVTWDLTDHGPYEQSVLPHPSSHLVIENDAATVHGPTRTRFTRVLKGKGRVVAIRFQPAGLRPFLNSPATSLVDTECPAAPLFASASADLVDRVTKCRDDGEAMALLEAAVAACQPHGEQQIQVRTANAIVELIAADRSVTTVAKLAEVTKTHPRQLQRLLANFVGLGPKAIIRRYRLQEAAAAALVEPNIDWSAKATELGYYDQAHLIGDFTATIGMAPAAYARTRSRHGDKPLPTVLLNGSAEP